MSNPTFPNTPPSLAGGDGQPPESPASSSGLPQARDVQVPAMGIPAGSSPIPATLIPSGPPVPVQKARRRRWVMLGVIGALLLVIAGGGTVFVSGQLGAPSKAATQFCTDLQAQNYPAAYTLFSVEMRAELTQDQFVQDARELGTAEGKIQTCGQASGSGAYRYSLFGSSATITLSIRRSGVWQGTVNMRNESGRWTIAALAPTLLGASLGAIQTFRGFCTALQHEDYTAAYALMDSRLQQASSRDSFTQLLTDHDDVDGRVSACGLAGVAPGNTDSTTQITAAITRSILGQQQGDITLAAAGGAWKITSIGQTLQGTDLGSVQVATQLCVDLAVGDVSDAYSGLTSSEFQAAVTSRQFDTYFQLAPGERYTGCDLDLTTFTLSGTLASFTIKFEVQVDTTGQTADAVAKVTFIQEGGAWKILQVETQS